MLGPDQFVYFGYGSLVNRTTHHSAVAEFINVRLSGWRRHWLPRPASKSGHVALLSAYPDPNGKIDGLLVVDLTKNLPALNAREVRYDRIEIEYNVFSAKSPKNKVDCAIPATPVNIYRAKHLSYFDDSGKCKILRSYLDTVMQGYLNEFGLEGLLHFINSTDNFEIGIREDRHNPVYSRPVSLNFRERAQFDLLVPPSA